MILNGARLIALNVYKNIHINTEGSEKKEEQEETETTITEAE